MNDLRLLEQLVNRAPVLVFIKGRDARFRLVNQMLAQTYGRDAAEIIGRRNEEAFPGEDLSRVAALHEQVVRERRPITVEEVIEFDGLDRTFLTSRFPLVDDAGEVVAVGGVAVDITERATAVAELRDSEQRYRHLLEHTSNGYMSFDVVDGRFVYANDNAHAMFGAEPGALARMTPTDISPELQPDGTRSVDGVARLIQRALSGENVVVDWTHRRLDGEAFPTRLWLGSDGEREVWASLVDMSDVVAAQHAMERQKQLLDRTQALAKVGGWELDLQDGTLRWTLETYRIYGMDPAEGSPTLDEALARHPPADAAKVRETLASLQPGDAFEIEIDVVGADGSRSTVRASGTAGIDHVVGMIQDLTDRRSLEDQLLQSQKLESLGRLAGGIAHDFNNLLTVISNAVDFIDRSVAHQAASDIADIRQATRRATDLTTQMLAFARRQGGKPRAFDPNHVIERTARMMGRLVGEDIVIDTQLDADLGSIRADPAHLEQVLVNLIVNARDAMPEGGRLTLRSGRAVGPGGRTERSDPATAWVRIDVIDTGTGMSKEVQRRVFEPFYTTKPPGKGTGLGMSTVYGILQRWGGDITIESRLGRGTAMTTWWPEIQASVLETSDQGPAGPPSLGDEAILLVEDDDAVRRVTARGLRAAGFEVAVADGPEVALSLVKSRSDRFDLVITDVVMPGIGGIELAQRLRADDPEVRVLFVSGYAADALEARGLRLDRFELLEKPFDLKDLTGRVRAILDR